MASRNTALLVAATALVAAAALLPAPTSAAKKYRVGDGAGWDVGVDYDAWASGKSFKAGDTLEFVYPANQEHDVVFVDAASYAACDVPENAPTMVSGDDNVVLSEPGQYFFICGAEGHCGSGMKLTVIAT